MAFWFCGVIKFNIKGFLILGNVNETMYFRNNTVQGKERYLFYASLFSFIETAMSIIHGDGVNKHDMTSQLGGRNCAPGQLVRRY